jgi:hypothetical protein
VKDNCCISVAPAHVYIYFVKHQKYLYNIPPSPIYKQRRRGWVQVALVNIQICGTVLPRLRVLTLCVHIAGVSCQYI